MPSISVTVKDETTGGKTLHSLRVELTSSLVSVAEIIELRVVAEVSHYNKKRETNYYGLIQPEGAEIAVNGFRLEKFRPIDAKKQVSIAKDAFKQNGFFILIDNIQPESLEQVFVVHQDSEISFVKLTPLVGG
jgi:hypothetical protein